MTDELARIADAIECCHGPLPTKETAMTDELTAYPDASYVAGIRDLANMSHVSEELGGVLRDCADVIERQATAALSTESGLKPTQADRDAAGALIGKVGLSWSGDMIREGNSDDHDYVQAFARHRVQSEADAFKAGMLIAAEIADSETGVYTEDGEGDAWIALRISRAIRDAAEKL